MKRSKHEMPLLRRLCVLVLSLAMYLGMSLVVRADAVTDWNAMAIQTIAGQAAHPGATGLLDSAMVQAAVYDAVNAIEEPIDIGPMRLPAHRPAASFRATGERMQKLGNSPLAFAGQLDRRPPNHRHNLQPDRHPGIGGAEDD